MEHIPSLPSPLLRKTGLSSVLIGLEYLMEVVGRYTYIRYIPICSSRFTDTSVCIGRYIHVSEASESLLLAWFRYKKVHVC